MRERLLQPSAKGFGQLQKNSPSSSPEISTSSKQCGVLPDECMAYSAENGSLNPPLQTQVWYHGTLNRLEAEKYLQNCRLGSFVIRTEHDIEYFMSVRGSNSTLHLQVICIENGSFMLGESGPSFTCILELVEHYMKHPLLLQNEEHLFLQYKMFTVTQ
ncbi:SH2 domain-containing adapter protein F-like [Xenopus laevis]|uniref:SH2 domain-containing adapter protein F-like n=1 Tax=Xenopus laevis TaxID=8355 RepID=A0A8J1LWT9_XENLA|nr:SH2 domain-containing adapter protein F-like [Xenopus laevis]